ncbi:MAG: hypothetical protein GXZ02_04210 [Clostridiales bacterium]|nr:hypothetical protein [Clostridiales bacterium]
MKNVLNNYHPFAAFLPFAAAIVFSMLSFHPVYSAISLLCSIVTALKINGTKALQLTLRFCLPIFLLTVLINTAFNKNGMTVLFYVGDRPILYEGLLFGLCSAAALSSVLLWFSCYSTIIDSEKFLFLTSRISPTAALLVSMTLGQITLMRKKIEEIDDAQTGIYGEERKEFKQKLRLAMLKISVLLSWSMEDSVQTADSMHSRGYGTGRMTKMNPYVFSKKDYWLLSTTVLLLTPTLLFIMAGKATFVFYPITESVQFDAISIAAYLFYFILLALPLLVEMKGAVKWHYYISKV